MINQLEKDLNLVKCSSPKKNMINTFNNKTKESARSSKKTLQKTFISMVITERYQQEENLKNIKIRKIKMKDMNIYNSYFVMKAFVMVLTLKNKTIFLVD